MIAIEEPRGGVDDAQDERPFIEMGFAEMDRCPEALAGNVGNSIRPILAAQMEVAVERIAGNVRAR